MDRTILLPNIFNIGAVYEVAEEIKKIIVSEDEIILDARNIEIVDILGIQLIVCVAKTVLKNGIKLKVNNIGDELQKYLSYVSLPSEKNLIITRDNISGLNYTQY